MSNCYVALYTKKGEVNAKEYRRAVVTSWGFHRSYGVYNSHKILFPPVKSDWGELIQFGLFSEPTGGTAHIIRNVENISGAIKRGRRYCFSVGSLTIMFEGDWGGK